MSRVDKLALFAAAREDAPSERARDELFRRVALTTGVAAGTAATATALSAAAPSTSLLGLKLLGIGVAVGAACTALGVIVAVTVVRPTAPTSPAQPAPSSVAAGRGVATSPPAEPAPSASSELAAPEVTSRPNTGAAAAPRAAATAAAEPGPAPRAKPVAIAEAPPRSDLSDEASLVTAARTALVAGDPARALLLVQSARKSKARSLEPEELSLEARALRALGRADEALATELALRGRYPAHALAR